MVRFTGKRNHIVENLPVLEQDTRVEVLTNIQVWIRGDYITLNRCDGATLINLIFSSETCVREAFQIKKWRNFEIGPKWKQAYMLYCSA